MNDGATSHCVAHPHWVLFDELLRQRCAPLGFLGYVVKVKWVQTQEVFFSRVTATLHHMHCEMFVKVNWVRILILVKGEKGSSMSHYNIALSGASTLDAV